MKCITLQNNPANICKQGFLGIETIMRDVLKIQSQINF